MDIAFKDKFTRLWEKYFAGAPLPIVFFYVDNPPLEGAIPAFPGHRCLICDLARPQRGECLYFNSETVGCAGGKRYLGFSTVLRPDFEYFLSCGIAGKMEGERYKKSPELVKEMMKSVPKFEAPAKFVVFKRWDMLEAADEPAVVIFFARPDVLSGLFTLANFDERDPNGVYAPFASGCGAIVQIPYLENASDRPRCVLGMFDVSARPCVSADTLAFAAPIKKFTRMVDNMEESFLTTASWRTVNNRIGRGKS